jgi:hypothetical protein
MVVGVEMSDMTELLQPIDVGMIDSGLADMSWEVGGDGR